ncbi:substrate-binding periplasmic protein [Paucidesulfovibrio longus]|uniref:substrate-binding periplasmic protein n=1 Tax=Paucidesulfovibrio longus TaxID=889 RepID=UPI0003B60D12|nr:transporter substrate-binding domain-containing protein [Paucidesulfovibrio longus]
MHLSKLAFLLALAGLLLAFPPQAAALEPGGSPDEYVMLFPTTSYMPFFSGNAGKTSTEYGGHGMLVDLLDAFEKKYPQYAMQRVRLPRVRANDWLARKQPVAFALHSPFFGGLVTGGFDFSLPLWTTADSIYTLKDDPLRYERPEDLRGVPMGVIRGFGYGLLDPLLRSGAIASIGVETDRQLYQLLLDGRVRAIVANRHVLPYSMYRYGLNPLRLRAVGPPLYEFELSVMIRKDHPEILEALNDFIRESRADGLLDGIQRRWLGEACPAVKE